MKWLSFVVGILFLACSEVGFAQDNGIEGAFKGSVKMVEVASYSHGKFIEEPRGWTFSSEIFSQEGKLQAQVNFRDEGNVVVLYNEKGESLAVIVGTRDERPAGAVDELKQEFVSPVKSQSMVMGRDGNLIVSDSPNEFGRKIIVEGYTEDKKYINQIRVVTYSGSGKEIKNEVFSWVEGRKTQYEKQESQYNEFGQTTNFSSGTTKSKREGEVLPEDLKTRRVNLDLAYELIPEQLDDKGNWQIRRWLLEGKEVGREKRIITYY